MKKFLFVPVLALAAAATFSCSKNITGNDGENISGDKEVIVFPEPQIEIGAVSAGTKTTLEDSRIHWEDVEYISLFNADGSNTWTYELTAGAGTTSATFTAQGEPQAGFTYAIYPQNSNVPTGAAISANLATDQTYSENGFPTLYPMGAKTEDGKTFEFVNLATVLRLPLTGTGTIASITIESVGGEPLAGAATVDFSGGTPVMTAAAEGASASVTLNCTDLWPSINESDPVYFNFVLFPGTYSKGFRFTINESNGNSTTATTGTSPIELVAGSFKNFDSPLTIDTPQGWNLTGAFTDNWNSWIELEGGHGTYFCNANVPEGQTEFKLRNGANRWWGQDATVDPSEPKPVILNENGSGNLKIASGNYDFYFLEDYHELIVTEHGTAAFSVTGEFNNWSDEPMFIENGYLVAKGINLSGNFKLRACNSWDYYDIGFFGSGGDLIESAIGTPLTVTNKGGNIYSKVSGTYDLYLDMKKANGQDGQMTLWVMPAGEVPTE